MPHPSNYLRHLYDVQYLPFTVSGMFISLVATGTFVFKFGPHTRLKEYTQMWYQHFHRGFKVQLNKKLRELILEVIEDAEHLTPEEQELTKSFMANAYDTYCWGGYFSQSGVLLSLPYFFAYEDVSDVNLKKITFGARSSDPEVDRKSVLSQAMLESDEAKVGYS